MMLRWLRRRQEARRLAQADDEALIHDHGTEAYGEARRREHDVILPDATTHAGRVPGHWRRVALDDSNAQFSAVRWRSCERVISDLLLPFPVGPGTGKERQKRLFKMWSSSASLVFNG